MKVINVDLAWMDWMDQIAWDPEYISYVSSTKVSSLENRNERKKLVI